LKHSFGCEEFQTAPTIILVIIGIGIMAEHASGDLRKACQ
jgi:hypothetical protein